MYVRMFTFYICCIHILATFATGSFTYIFGVMSSVLHVIVLYFNIFNERIFTSSIEKRGCARFDKMLATFRSTLYGHHKAYIYISVRVRLSVCIKFTVKIFLDDKIKVHASKLVKNIQVTIKNGSNRSKDILSVQRKLRALLFSIAKKINFPAHCL